ncbi:MAG TPA: peptide-methionine (S)-S-oxide reductase MsrA [Candidatus Saccharimonadales bacterium]|nr:peptide-methionine (S)-S-oxide reductase MsrA [Candidatus Saccharimonadales bacterium]
MTTYVLGGGCFWCLDAIYRRIQGVAKVVSGYAGGATQDPRYYQVASGTTGHAEVVQITFDETIVPPETILDIYFSSHNPTTLNQQGADIGTQYRSLMLYADETQHKAFQEAVERAKKLWDDPIVTNIESLEVFYPAEEEHQDYFNKNPDAGYCAVVIEPKLIKARKAYARWFKEDS